MSSPQSITRWVEIAWREAGLRKRLCLYGNYPRGVTVRVIVQGAGTPWRGIALWLGWAAMVALVAWLAGPQYAGPAALVAAFVIWSVRRSPPPEFYQSAVGVISTPIEAARDALLDLLAQGWTTLHKFRPEDLRRQYHAMLNFVDSRLLPLLQQTAREWGGSAPPTRGRRAWELRWSGPRGPASLLVDMLPGDEVRVTTPAHASVHRPRPIASYRVDWGDLEGLQVALAQARLAAESEPEETG